MNVVGSGERKSFQNKCQNDVVVVVVQSRRRMDGCRRSCRWASLNMYPVMREEAADAALASPARGRARTMSHRLAVTYSVGPTSQVNELFPACITLVCSFSEIGKGDRDRMTRKESSNDQLPLPSHRCHNDIFSQKNSQNAGRLGAVQREREREREREHVV